jgi:hypothetical protein
MFWRQEKVGEFDANDDKPARSALVPVRFIVQSTWVACSGITIAKPPQVVILNLSAVPRVDLQRARMLWEGWRQKSPRLGVRFPSRGSAFFSAGSGCAMKESARNWVESVSR